jgi:integrase
MRKMAMSSAMRNVPAGMLRWWRTPRIATIEARARFWEHRDNGGRRASGPRNQPNTTSLRRWGLRISEALALFPKDLDPAGGSLRVLHGKGNKARTAPLPGDAAEAVNRWLDCRNRRRLTVRHPLFCTLKGEPLWDSYVRELCKRLAAKARIEKRVHPHGLRHGWALGQVQAGTSLNAIQQLLGDRSPHPTSVLSASDRRLSTCLCCAINSSTGYADPSAGERRSSDAGTYRCASAKPPNRTRV